MHVALKIEYDGARYSGFQFQPHSNTIQGELEKSIFQLTNHKTSILGAGRTDAGVHAKGQIISFHINSKYSIHTIVNALNFHLPNDIAVKSANVVSKEFHPRKDATSRTYVYTILNSFSRSPLVEYMSHHSSEALKMEIMEKSIQKFKGIHDFELFSGALEDPTASTIREIYNATISRTSDIIKIRIEGSSFLPRQVRRMSGAILDLGRSKLTTGQFDQLLEVKRTSAVAHALPSKGLCLEEVKYRNNQFWDNENGK